MPTQNFLIEPFCFLTPFRLGWEKAQAEQYSHWIGLSIANWDRLGLDAK